MTRKRTIGPNASTITIRLPRDQRERVDATARREKITPSALIRHALVLREAVRATEAGLPAK